MSINATIVVPHNTVNLTVENVAYHTIKVKPIAYHTLIGENYILPQDIEFEISATGDKYVFNDTELDLTSIAKHGILGEFVYGNPLNTFTGTINWGDDAVEYPVTLSYADNKGTATAKHTYGTHATDGPVELTATLKITDASLTTKTQTFKVTLKKPHAFPTSADKAVTFNPGSFGIGFAYVNRNRLWNQFFELYESYDFIELHDPAGHPGDPMRLDQCVVLTDYVNAMDPSNSKYLDYVARADWGAMVAGALNRRKWLMIYIGGTRWGFGFNALIGETKEQYVERALIAMKPCLDALPDCMAFDTIMGLLPADLNNYTASPEAVYHANLVYGPGGAEEMLINEIQRRGITVVLEPAIFEQAPHLHDCGTETAYGTWSNLYADVDPWMYKVVYSGQVTWNRVGNLVTIHSPGHNLVSGINVSIQQSSNLAALPLITTPGTVIDSDNFRITVSGSVNASGTGFYAGYNRTDIVDLPTESPRFVYCNASWNDPVLYPQLVANVQAQDFVPLVLVGNIGLFTWP